MHVPDRLVVARHLGLERGVIAAAAPGPSREDLEGLPVALKRLGSASQIGVDPGETAVGGGQLVGERGVLRPSPDERFVIGECRFE